MCAARHLRRQPELSGFARFLSKDALDGAATLAAHDRRHVAPWNPRAGTLVVELRVVQQVRVFRLLALEFFGVTGIQICGKEKAEILGVTLIVAVVPRDEFQERKPGEGRDGNL